MTFDGHDIVMQAEDITIVLERAANPGPMTLSGTNSYVVRVAGDAWIIDPGPADAAHLKRLVEIAQSLGQTHGIVLTHDHSDHSEGVEPLRAMLGGPPLLRFGEPIESPFKTLHTPGHSADHLVLLLDNVLFSGDLILGGSSTIVPPGGGTLIAYFESLREIARLEPDLILPGHGPPIENAADAIAAQLQHRVDREDGLIDALGAGLRDREALLSRVWADVPEELRLAAHVTMQSHLEKLDIEGALPDDFEPQGRLDWTHNRQ